MQLTVRVPPMDEVNSDGSYEVANRAENDEGERTYRCEIDDELPEGLVA